jgi:hypothetical protein
MRRRTGKERGTMYREFIFFFCVPSNEEVRFLSMSEDVEFHIF